MDAHELAKRKQASMRTRCKLVCTELKDQTTQKDGWTVAELQARLDLLTMNERELEDLNKQVEMTAGPEYFGESYDSEGQRIDAIRTEIRESMASIHLAMSDAVQKTSQPARTAIGAPVPSVKLPALPPPTFSGEATKYRAFRETFEATVDVRTDISESEKLRYLLGMLKGEALKIVEPLEVTADDYKVALDRLEEWYGSSEVIGQAHVNAIMQMKAVKDANNLVAVCELARTLEYHVRALKTLNVKFEAYNDALYERVKQMFPANMAVKFHKKGLPKTMESWVRFIREQVITWKECGLLTETATKEKVKEVIAKEKIIRTAATLVAGVDEENVGVYATTLSEQARKEVNRRAPKLFCALCFNNDHWTDACPVQRSWSEKRRWLFNKGRCFNCASRDHLSKDCKNTRAICSKCNGKHYTVLCPKEEEKNEAAAEVVQNKGGEIGAFSIQTSGGGMLMQTLHAYVSGSEGCFKEVRVMFDSGAQGSFIKREMAERLKLLCIGQEVLNLNVFGGNSQKCVCDKVVVPLYDRLQRKVSVINCLVIDVITTQHMSYPPMDLIEKCAKLGINVADTKVEVDTSDEIALLIGINFYCELMTERTVRLEPRVLATQTKLGWLVQGTSNCVLKWPRNDASVMCVGSKCELQTVRVESLWELDAIGINDDEPELMEGASLEIERIDGRYYVGMPWLPNKREELNNNANEAIRRLHSELQSLQRKPELFERVHDAINTYLKNSHAELVSDALSMRVPAKYVLPHFAVVREGTTTDVRVVYDASSSEANQISLNECMSPGVDRKLDVIKALIRFRRDPIALVADLEKAFLKIRIKPEERSYFRFLWLKQGSALKHPFEISEYQMTSVTFGVNCSPAVLKEVIHHHLDKYEDQSELVEQTKQNLYVDDLLSSVQSESIAFNNQELLQTMFDEGGFNIRKWACNSKAVMERWKKMNVQVNEKTVVNVMGQAWMLENDELRVPIPIEVINKSKECTKREIIRVVSSIYDPLGAVGCLTIKGKMLFQLLWKEKTGWDDQVSDEINASWVNWKREALDCTEVYLPRWSGCDRSATIELHSFNDASPYGYGAMLFCRILEKDGSKKVCFQLARYRVAPLKQKSLPKLELLSASLASKLVEFWLKHSGVLPAKLYHWADSTIALGWIKSTKLIKDIFVNNRVKEIRRVTSTDDWRHCPGTCNVADLGTRACVKLNSETIKEWLSGPRWLIEEYNWPNGMITEVVDIDVLQTTCRNVNEIRPVLPLENYSSLTRLLRHTGWLIKFCQWKSKVEPSVRLESVELKAALNYWIKYTQKKHFGMELACILEEVRIPRSSKLSKFRLVYDDDCVLRLHTRIWFDGYTFDQRYPVLLPKESELTRLLIVNAHESLCHAGSKTVITFLRNKYWIVGLNQTCKKIVNDCLICRKIRGKAYVAPTGGLPKERVEFLHAFEHIGVDFAGPIDIKEGTLLKKAYILLLTCLGSRAVHLEVTTSLSTERFLMAFQRFMARRGQPNTVFSDNASTFKKAEKMFRQIVNDCLHAPTFSFFKVDPMSWRFIVERAPWMGGAWERLIGLMKVSLRRIIGKASLNFEELTTLLCAVEGVMNSRPLMEIQGGEKDPIPLTPSHLVIGRGLTHLPIYDTNVKITEISCMQRYKYLQTLFQHFIARWRNEYVLLLRQNHQVEHGTTYQPKEGDVVLLKQESVKRHLYPMVRIEKLQLGRDGVARSAVIRTADGKRFRRPVNLLFPVELPLFAGGSVSKVDDVSIGGGAMCERE